MTRSVARSLCDSWASLLIMTMMTSSIQPLALHDEMKFTSTKPLWSRDCLSSRNSMTNRLLLSSVKYSTSKTRERSVGQGQCSSRYMAERCNICCWNECRVIVGPPGGTDRGNISWKYVHKDCAIHSVWTYPPGYISGQFPPPTITLPT